MNRFPELHGDFFILVDENTNDPGGLRRRSAAAPLLGWRESNPADGMHVRLLCLLCVVYGAASATS